MHRQYVALPKLQSSYSITRYRRCLESFCLCHKSLRGSLDFTAQCVWRDNGAPIRFT